MTIKKAMLGAAISLFTAGAAFAAVYFYLGINFGRLVPSRLGEIAASASQVIRTQPKLRVHAPPAEDENDDQYHDLDEEADRILEEEDIARLGRDFDERLVDGCVLEWV